MHELCDRDSSSIRRNNVSIGLVVHFVLSVGSLLLSDREACGDEIPSFAKTHCVRCHNDQNSEANFRIDNAPTDVQDSQFGSVWSRAYERINSGEMPPKDEPQPTADERYQTMEWISKQMLAWDATQNAKIEKVSFKRLSRVEYVNTLRDLLGFNYYPTDPGGLPEDPNWHGMERMGNVLSLTPSHIERYIAAAEFALENVVPLSAPPQPWRHEWSAPGTISAKGYTERLATDPTTPRHRMLIGPANNWKHYVGGIERIVVPHSGQYRIRIQASGLRPGLRPTGGSVPHMVLYNVNLDRILLEQDVDAPEDQPKTYEFHVELPLGPHDLVLRNELPGYSPYEPHQRAGFVEIFTKIAKGRAPFLEKVSDDQFRPYVPLLILDYFTIESVVDPWPPAAQRALFAEFDRDDSHSDERRRESIIAQFAQRAFRRPLRPHELDAYVAISRKTQATGLTFESSVRESLLAILCSHDFLFLVEGETGSVRTRLNDHELASRLSYFLWSTAPDALLLQLAFDGQLHEPSVLATQTRRMLQDERASQFAADFSRQWLRLNDVGKFPPDKKLYPTFDAGLHRSMVSETQAFFAKVFHENRSVKELLDSDWTMVNNRLAAHYNIPDVVDFTLKPIPLKPDQHRGGLLTQAAVLTMTSDGFRHRPVHRGKWVSEVMLGIVPPPPPPNAGTIPATAEGEAKTTLRAKLESHRSQASCDACHRNIDPLGFPFDNFDAIGRWRTVEEVATGTGESPVIDASGQLADGRGYAGPDEFKKLLLADSEKLATHLAEQIAQYGLRRTLTFSDKQQIASIVRSTQAEGWKLQSIIEALMLNELFQTR
jgi:hypothetical protein